MTGQQAGLFGGPFFTLLKALTAVQLAEQVTQQHGVPTAPVFWIDAEDHDWDEVRACRVFGLDSTTRTVSLPERVTVGPVGAVRLGADIQTALVDLEALLQPTEFTDRVMERLKSCYQPETSMAGAFAKWMESLLGPLGLVVFDSSDPVAKPLVADIFETEIGHPGRTSHLASQAGERLTALGYHAQVVPPPDAVALFELDGTGRRAIRSVGDAFDVGGRTETSDDLLRAARESPERFSPNVLLRPLVQDTLFPTACYVAGPSELAYLGQLGDVYGAFGVPMPLIQPRASATLLDANAMRFLTSQSLAFHELRPHDDAALNRLLEAQLPAAVEQSLSEAEATIAARMALVSDAVSAIDATLVGAARSTSTRMETDLKKLHGKVIQAAKRKNETFHRQFHHARAQAFPDGAPQERSIGLVSFLNGYGFESVERLATRIPLDPGAHWVLTL